MFGFPSHPQMPQANKRFLSQVSHMKCCSLQSVMLYRTHSHLPTQLFPLLSITDRSGRSAESRGLLNEGWRQYGLGDAAGRLFTVGKQRCRCILLMRVNLSHILIWQKLVVLFWSPWRLLPCSSWLKETETEYDFWVMETIQQQAGDGKKPCFLGYPESHLLGEKSF